MTRKSAYARSVALPVGLAAVVMSAACGGGADDDGSTELTVATAAQPDTPSNQVMQWYFNQVEERSNGQLTFDVLPPDSLCEADEVAECTQDGRADVGVSIPDYTPQMFPTDTVVSIPFTADNAHAVTQALDKANTEHEGAQQVWEQNGLVPVSHWPVGRLMLGSPEEVDSMADMQGQRWRVSGPYLQSAVEETGGSNVALTAPETYEGIERGVADAVGFAIDGAIDYKLMELLPYWTDPGTGHYSTFGMWMNQSTYDGLPEDMQEVVDNAAEDLNTGDGVEQFAEGAAGQCDTLLEGEEIEGVDRWSEEATQEWEDAVGDDLSEQWTSDAEDAGLEDASGYLDMYTSALEESEDAELIEDPVVQCIDRAEDE
ncbi:TRAP-type C4-dicarboxylate transport system substrate-binding protein [Lipingzhangella halophila]|uniref:TRAP-type C4-dicarboxylate transport system substrate-binding protein n=1 Tax=Lipingzhangella halophila TaxID=1783352 RepID=A0A7W7W0T4_9ACTN|nr:TRAP transporter substrate-binding protein DctP [Lipingzhangella halophila]MBB4929578.1 TRAP-type C4-dicarboxylate transport system substrate-binding protein [Lipingzhangella halophila]